MLQGIDLNQVRQYNASLKQYRDKAANLNAEIEYTNKELDRLCTELSAELGVKVTRDNVEQVFAEQVEKINSTLQSGNAVLQKIASEEQSASQPVTPVQTAAPVQPVMQAQPVTPVATVQPAAPVAPQAVQGSVFNGQAATMPGQQPAAPIAPMFNLGQ